MKEKFKNIEFIRFCFAEILVLFHLRDFLFRPYSNIISEYKYMDAAIKNGEQVVDFFFIISGFLLIYTLKDISTTDFIKKKVARFFPTIIFISTLYWIEGLLGYCKFDFLNTLLSDILLFNSTGLVITKGSMSSIWFVAVLFWISIFYFYIARYFDKKINYLIFAGITWVGYTMLIQRGHGSLNGNSITIFNSFISLGLLRGLAGIALGCLICLFYLDKLKNYRFTNHLYLYSICEISLFIFLFSHITFYKNPISNDFIYIIAFSLLLLFLLIKQGVLSRLLEIKFSVTLGRYSFCLFISHGLFLKLINTIFSKDFVISHIVMTPIIILIITSLFSVFLYHIIEIPGSKLMNKLLFLQAENSSLNVENPERESFAKLHQRSN